MSVAIGIPISRYFDWRWVKSTYGLINDVHGNIEFLTSGNHERFKPIEQARNEIVENFLKKRHEWLLFFDSDATAEYGTLNRLLSWRVPMVSALCFKRRQIVSPAFQIDRSDDEMLETYRSIEIDTVYDWINKYGQLSAENEVLLPNPPEGSLLEVDRVGTHCLLIHRDVIKAVPEPRFERITPPENGSTGSDYDFCMKARRAGVPIYVDMSVISGHLDGSRIIAGMDFMMSTIYINQMKKNFI